MVNMVKHTGPGVSLIKGSKMLVFMADQIANVLNKRTSAEFGRGFGAPISRMDGETDREWCTSLFTIAHCQ